MADYPQLAKMGIHNPEQIEKFMVNGINNYDVLRIIYARDDGSLLPSSRTYEFLRIPREISATSGESQTSTVLETNPNLRAAIAELKQLLDQNTIKKNSKKELLEQIRLLEEDIEYIRELAERL